MKDPSTDGPSSSSPNRSRSSCRPGCPLPSSTLSRPSIMDSFPSLEQRRLGIRWVRILIRKTIPPKTLLHCAVADVCLADHLSARYLCVPRPLTVRFKHLTADCAYLAHAHV